MRASILLLTLSFVNLTACLAFLGNADSRSDSVDGGVATEADSEQTIHRGVPDGTEFDESQTEGQLDPAAAASESEVTADKSQSLSSKEPSQSESKEPSQSESKEPSQSESSSSNSSQSESSSSGGQSESSSNSSQSESSSSGSQSEFPRVPEQAEQKRRFNCSLANRSSEFDQVQLLNGSDFSPLKRLLSSSGACGFVLFYLPHCPYSADTAPGYNAMPRLFPRLHFFAVDAGGVSSLYANCTTALVPYVRAYSGKQFAGAGAGAKTPQQLAAEVANVSGHSPAADVSLLPQDWLGPVPCTVQAGTDYCLLLCCCLLLLLAARAAAESPAALRCWRWLPAAIERRFRRHRLHAD